MPSRWHGSPGLLRSLGLSTPRSRCERSDLRAVMQGFSPLSGEPLRPVGSNGTRVAGVELMMAPPKSVSALWATAGPYRRAQIEVAHRRAVASALAANRARGCARQTQERRGRSLRARQEPARRRVRPHLQPPRPRPGGRRNPRPPAALPSRCLRRGAQRRQARRGRIAPALPLRPRERSLVPSRACRQSARARSADRAPHRAQRALLRGQRRPRAIGEPLVLSLRRRRSCRPALPPALRPRAAGRGAGVADDRHPRLQERCGSDRRQRGVEGGGGGARPERRAR